jgi:hypothetical protein
MKPSAPADHREQKRFCNELSHESRARCAESGANRKFFLARRGARQQQMPDVGASNEQHEKRGAECDEKWPAHVADGDLVERQHLNAVIFVVDGVLSARAVAQRWRGPRSQCSVSLRLSVGR